jgi:hypothetical protein
MDPYALEEFAALRATIRERGTARVWIFASTIAAWAAASLTITLVGTVPLTVLIPLALLAAGFEAVYSLHLGVERIGRYLQAFVEERPADPSARWETIAMEFGRGHRAATTDPLFAIIFMCAAFLNFLPALLVQPVVAEILTVGGAHLLFVTRTLVARRAAASQRVNDLQRFRTLRDSLHDSQPRPS